MKAAVAYISVTSGSKTLDFLSRFVSTYRDFPAGHDHDLIIVGNGGPPGSDCVAALAGTRCTAYPRSNDGWDIGAYLELSRTIAKNYDLLVCLGESVYFHKPGWLARIIAAWGQHGPGLYGIFSSHVFTRHLNTTAFACSPEWLAKYPVPVQTRAQRYQFEHGKSAFWRWMKLFGMKSWLVTWDGCWGESEWRSPGNILWRGDQTNCLMWCNHSDNFLKLSPAGKVFWSFHADRRQAA